MPPFREYLCGDCSYQFEEINTSQDPDVYRNTQCRCGSRATLLPAMIGGYIGSTGGASTRPKNSTSMKSGKAFTKSEEKKTE